MNVCKLLNNDDIMNPFSVFGAISFDLFVHDLFVCLLVLSLILYLTNLIYCLMSWTFIGYSV